MNMRHNLFLVLLVPFLATAQVPIMGTPPVPVATEKHAEATKTTPNNATKQKQTAVSVPALELDRSRMESLPPPSRITKDLYNAVIRGNLDISEALIKSGADINCRNCGDKTLLTWAAAFNHDVLRWLLARGAKINQVDASGNYPLHGSMMGSLGANVQNLNYLLENGADPNAVDVNGNTVLSLWAAYGRSVEHRLPIIDRILSYKANINHVNKYGYSVLMLALASSYDCAPPLVRYLYDHGADISQVSHDGNTAQSLAYTKAIAGAKSCNQVLALLQEPRAQSQSDAAGHPTDIPLTSSDASTPKDISISIKGEWQGVFNATVPRQGTAMVTAVVSDTGDVIFSSQRGLQGSGRLILNQETLNGSFTAKSPLDREGKPVYQTKDGTAGILFTINGTASGGILKGKYTSQMESGTFTMCNAATYQTTADCKPASPSLLGILKSLTSN